jgi:hypothetical protein
MERMTGKYQNACKGLLIRGDNSYPVIPAKAGIQASLPQSWIPAAVYPGENRGRDDI